LSVSELGEVELSDPLITNMSGNSSCTLNDGKFNWKSGICSHYWCTVPKVLP